MANSSKFSHLCALLALNNLEANYELQIVQSVLDRVDQRRFGLILPHEYVSNRWRLARVRRLNREAKQLLAAMKAEDTRLQKTEKSQDTTN